MAITILNEFVYVGDITSSTISPFMSPIVYFKVSGASAITNPVAEIEYAGSSEVSVFEAIFEKTESGEHYYYVDISEVAKFILRYFDGTEYPDTLEFINGNLRQIYDEYMRSVTVNIYFERGTGGEQTTAITSRMLYLSDKHPYTYGFNLYNILYNAYMQDLRWTKDTYNALFFYSNATFTIKVNDVSVYSAYNAPGYYQYKFDKTAPPLIKGLNKIEIITSYATKTIYVDYDPTCTTKHSVCWQHPQLGYVSYPFEGAMITETNVGRGIEIEKVFTSMVNVSQLTEQLGYKKSKTITLRAKVDKKYWPLFEDLYNSRHVYLYTGASGEDDSLATWMECRVTGGYSDNDTRNAKIFTVELQAAAQFPISF